MQTKLQRRILCENLLIAGIGLLALLALWASFFPAARFSAELMHLLETEKMTARLFSAVLLILLYYLYQRRRAAWGITAFLLGFGLLHHLLLLHRPDGIAAAQAVLLLLLVYFQGDFCCPSARGSLRRSLAMLSLAAGGILLNAGVSYHLARLHAPGAPRSLALWDSLLDAWGILFGVNAGSAPHTPLGRFEAILFWFTWGCMLLALLLALRPWIEHFLWSEEAAGRARRLVMAYGQNPASYLTLEADKLLYFGKGVDGVVPYGTVGSTVVVSGDPVCAPEDFPALLAEFREFCRRSDHRLILLGITQCYLAEYRRQGFGIAKCGEEARFDLASYDLSGKKGAKMRMNINHAARAGVTVAEYRPLERREAEVETAMDRISAEWLSGKKSGLLGFTIGTVGLDNPMDRRYFYARDAAGQICAFSVFCPYDGGRGYMADITRRAHAAPGGVTEKILYEALEVFRREGAASLSLGIAPLANLTAGSQRPNSVEWLLNFVYEHLNSCYGFKDLYRAKESYSPTQWLPGYYAWLPRIPSPSMFYAVVRIQNQRGMLDYVRALWQSRQSANRAG